MNIEKRNYLLVDVEVRAAAADDEGGDKKARGYASVFDKDSLDLGGFVERVAPGAFKRSLKEAKDGKRNIFALWAHRDDSPLGSTKSGKLVLEEDDHGLRFEMDTTRMTTAQLDALADGDLRMSFGFSVREQEWKEDDKGYVERTLIDVDLFEVSFVINPAYPDTEAAHRSFEAWKSEKRADNMASEHKVNKLMARAILKRIK